MGRMLCPSIYKPNAGGFASSSARSRHSSTGPRQRTKPYRCDDRSVLRFISRLEVRNGIRSFPGCYPVRTFVWTGKLEDSACGLSSALVLPCGTVERALNCREFPVTFHSGLTQRDLNYKPSSPIPSENSKSMTPPIWRNSFSPLRFGENHQVGVEVVGLARMYEKTTRTSGFCWPAKLSNTFRMH